MWILTYSAVNVIDIVVVSDVMSSVAVYVSYPSQVTLTATPVPISTPLTLQPPLLPVPLAHDLPPIVTTAP